MLVSEIIDDVISSELRQAGVANIGIEGSRDAVQTQNFKSLLSYVNQANLAIHKRFTLITKEVLIQTYPGVLQYTLPNDTITPLIAELRDGTNVTLNDEQTLLFSIFTPSPFIILLSGDVPVSVFDGSVQSQISILYSAAPSRVTALTEYLQLSRLYIEALSYYIAHKAFSSLSSMNNTESSRYLQLYEKSCKDIEEYGLLAEDTISNSKLSDRGFV